MKWINASYISFRSYSLLPDSVNLEGAFTDLLIFLALSVVKVRFNYYICNFALVTMSLTSHIDISFDI